MTAPNQLLLHRSRLVAHNRIDTTFRHAARARFSLRLPDRCVVLGVSTDLALVSMFNRVLQEFHGERCPAGLMAGAAAAAGFAVEVFVEQARDRASADRSRISRSRHDMGARRLSLGRKILR